MDALPTMTPSEALALPEGLQLAMLAAPLADRDGVAEAGERRQGFRLGDVGLMVRYEHGSELTELPALARLPNVPDWVLGVANLHGALLPVFDLARYAGLPATAGARSMLLVLLHGADAAGIVIDGLPRRLRFARTEADAVRTAPTRLASHVAGAALVDGTLWFDLDPASLLAALEDALHRGA